MMETPPTGSEVARLLESIQRDYEAAEQGLSGLAQGTATHQFITAKMERVRRTHEQLQALVGPDEARTLLAHTIWTHEDMGIEAV